MLPGAVHDLRAAREHSTLNSLAEVGIRCWADKGVQELAEPHACAPAGRSTPQASGRSTTPMPKNRALGEQAVATLKTWRVLRKLQCGTTRITNLVQAVFTLRLTCSNHG